WQPAPRLRAFEHTRKSLPFVLARVPPGSPRRVALAGPNRIISSRETCMTKLDRRSVLTGAAATGAALLTPMATPRARAAAPPAGTQNAGWYRYKVGTHE